MEKSFFFRKEDYETFKEDFDSFCRYKDVQNVIDFPEEVCVTLPSDARRFSSRKGSLPKDVQWKIMELMMLLCKLDRWKFIPHETFKQMYFTRRGDFFLLPDAFQLAKRPKLRNPMILVSVLAGQLLLETETEEEIRAVALDLKLPKITEFNPTPRFMELRQSQLNEDDECFVMLTDTDNSDCGAESSSKKQKQDDSLGLSEDNFGWENYCEPFDFCPHCFKVM